MFALVIYERASHGLFVARDRLGIKPLYYRVDEEHIQFASETKVLRGPQPPQVSRESLAAYLQWGACPETLLLDPRLQSFPAGHWCLITKPGPLAAQPYWSPGVISARPTGEPQQQVRKLLENSVAEHLLADVPVACFLSGGIDSSIVTALAARQSPGRLCTFSIGFKQHNYDETQVAAAVAERYGTDHQRIELGDAEVVDTILEAVHKLDLPSVDALNTYIVAQQVARRSIKVALSGLGGDELFGGYPIFRELAWLRGLACLPKPVKYALGWFGGTGRRVAEIPGPDPVLLAMWRRRFWTDAMLRQARLPVPNAIAPELLGVDPVTTPTGARTEPHWGDDFASVSWTELTHYLRHILLRDSDQMSMAVSLELRVPFLDHELVEYVLGLPSRIKTSYPGPKGLLVAAFRDLLPEAVYRRPRRPFFLPMREWMLGPLRPFVEDSLRKLTRLGWFDARFIHRFYQDFQAGRLHWTRLWLLVVLADKVSESGFVQNDRNHSQVKPRY
jgi:asparagine synthase (glutamine-hydrolysing)